MTCREKLALEHPELVRSEFHGGCKDCPSAYGYLEDPHMCAPGDDGCRACWDREIPEEKIDGKTIYSHIGPFEKPAIEPMKNNATNAAPHILDSGDRTVFESGAVRDCQAGKGRCDLLPLDIVGDYLEDPVICKIHDFAKTGRVDFLYEALWCFAPHWEVNGDRSWSKANPTMILETAVHFEDGAVKYGEDNWRKGIPAKRYIDSAVRHYLKFLRGDKDERHDRAFCWNLLCCAWTCVHKPELNDYIKTSEVIRG